MSGVQEGTIYIDADGNVVVDETVLRLIDKTVCAVLRVAQGRTPALVEMLCVCAAALANLAVTHDLDQSPPPDQIPRLVAGFMRAYRYARATGASVCAVCKRPLGDKHASICLGTPSVPDTEAN